MYDKKAGLLQNRVIYGRFASWTRIPRSPNSIRSSARWFERTFGTPTPPAGARVAEHLRRQQHAHPRANGVGKNARSISLGHQPSRGTTPCRDSSARGQDTVRVAAQSAQQRHREKPGRAARRHQSLRRRIGVEPPRHPDGGSHRGHAAVTTEPRCRSIHPTSSSQRPNRST